MKLKVGDVIQSEVSGSTREITKVLSDGYQWKHSQVGLVLPDGTVNSFDSSLSEDPWFDRGWKLLRDDRWRMIRE